MPSWKILLLSQDARYSVRIPALLSDRSGPGCQVMVQGHLAPALDVLAHAAFDAILLELRPAAADPLEDLTRLQQAAPAAPIILMCRQADAAFVPRAAAQGARGFVFKERLDAAHLMRALRRAVMHKAQEEALRRSEARLRDIIENMSESYYELDFNGYMTYVNKHMCAKSGWTLDEFRANPTQDFVAPEERERIYRVYQEVYKTGTPKKITDWKAVDRDGNTYDIETSIALIRDAAGNPIAFSGISREVTAKVAALKALEASKERYRNILENIQDAYFETDRQGRLTFFNAAMVTMSGYPAEELMALDSRDYMDARNAQIVQQAYQQIYATGAPNRLLQYEILTKNGEPRHVESAVSLMRDEAGRPQGFRGVARDITYRKEAELELAEAKARAEAATRAKSEFLANMSHEIRTPMNGIIGMYHLLQGTPLTPEQSDFVEIGRRSADTLLDVINDILDLSKLEAGQQKIECIDFDLRSTIDELVPIPARLAQEKGLELIYSIQPDVPCLLKGDPVRLRQALMHLMRNAVKFTPQGEVSLYVVLEETRDQKVAIRFTVNDTGIGISKADQARLFHSFHQVDNSSTRRYGGAGLGLAIASKLAQLMGGRMGVRSRVGQGATFWFTALFEKGAGCDTAPLPIPAELHGKRILIVDDNQAHLDIIEGYLNRWGCGCDRATGGELALALMHALAKAGAPYDLVISDLQMPEMDGAELGRRIKADDALRDSTLILLTSQAVPGAGDMQRAGYAACLTKPVRPSLLFDCLRTVLGRGQAAAPQSERPGLRKP